MGRGSPCSSQARGREWGTKGVRRGHGPFLPPALQALGVSSTSCQGPRRQRVLSRVAQTSALQSKPVDGFCSEPPMFAVQKHSFHKGKHPITGLYLFCFLIDSRSKEMFWKDFPFSSQQDEGDTTPTTAVPQLLRWAAPSSWLSTGNHEWSPGALGGSDSRSVLPTGVRPSPPSPDTEAPEKILPEAFTRRPSLSLDLVRAAQHPHP